MEKIRQKRNLKILFPLDKLKKICDKKGQGDKKGLKKMKELFKKTCSLCEKVLTHTQIVFLIKIPLRI